MEPSLLFVAFVPSLHPSENPPNALPFEAAHFAADRSSCPWPNLVLGVGHLGLALNSFRRMLPSACRGWRITAAWPFTAPRAPAFVLWAKAEGAAWFQENVDRGSRIWAGNVFVCDHKAVRLTLVASGLAPGRKPFLELHNPTDNEIHARVSAPPHAPAYGGLAKRVLINHPLPHHQDAMAQQQQLGQFRGDQENGFARAGQPLDRSAKR